jgi:hypothetical protein
MSNLGQHWQTWLLPYSIAMSLPIAVLCGVAGAGDVATVMGVIMLRNWTLVRDILWMLDLRPVFGLARGVGAVILLINASKLWKYLSDQRSSTQPVSASKNDGPKPMLWPSRTSHARFFPKTHSFSYSYLLVGIPIGWKGSAGGMVAADQALVQNASRSWYNVNAGDHLDRGYGHLGLDGKLKRYLESQVLAPRPFPDWFC